MARLDGSGLLFLRSVCKLTHVGHAQYYKGDGHSFRDFLEEEYPDLSNECVDRAEHSKRQDWSLEASYDIFPLMEPLIAYTVRTLLDKQNVLRDTVLMQAECTHFEAYVHVNAVMWRVVFKELRGLTNSKGLEINPLELNSLYEDLYSLGTLLLSAEAMVVFEHGFRPWPHVYKSNGRSRRFYAKVDLNLHADLERLNFFKEREDYEQYSGLLRQVLKCFGEGIIESLTYTMKNYLRQTGGKLANENREPWERSAVHKMVCHNNYAERPFAVLKAYAKVFPSLSLSNLAHLVHSLVNGTHRCAEIFGTRKKSEGICPRLPGIALTAHPEVKAAVNKLCSVRRKTVGEVTRQHREAYRVDKYAQIMTRKRKTKEKFDANVAKQAKIAANRDKAEETSSNSLCIDLIDLKNQLKSRSNSKSARLDFLKEQVYARIAGENPRSYPGLGSEWRKQGGKLRVSSNNTSQSTEDYLTQLVTAMLKEDEDTFGVKNTSGTSTGQDYIRALPTISLEHTNPKALAWKAEFSATIAQLAMPKDDPMYVPLQEKYVGQILFDNDTRATQKLFRIVAIQFVRSYSSSRLSCWEATCEPVFYDSRSGQFIVPADKKVEGSSVILANALQGYALAEYPTGMDSDATTLPWVDNYIQHFLDVIAPKYLAKSTQASPASSTISRCSRIQSSRYSKS